MVKKQKIEEFIKDVTEDSAPVESKPIVITKKDMQKKHRRKKKRKKRLATGFVCDDFEIMI